MEITSIALPLSNVVTPWRVGVDAAGDVFITGYNGDLEIEEVGSMPHEASRITPPFTALVAASWSGNRWSRRSVCRRIQMRNDVVELPRTPTGYGSQITLPFSGLDTPEGIAVDGAGDVFVADFYGFRVVELPAGGTTQLTLPFNGLAVPTGVAVDNAGDVFVTDGANNDVLELPVGGGAQMTLPFSGLNLPVAIAVDAAGNVIVTELRTAWWRSCPLAARPDRSPFSRLLPRSRSGLRRRCLSSPRT